MGFFKPLFLWNTKLNYDDTTLVNSFLDDSGKFLFYQMSRFDQHHAIAVARSIIAEVKDPTVIDYKTLMVSALLHDIGKVEGDFNFFSRILVGLIKRIAPNLRGKLAFTNPNTFWEKVRYGFYVDLIHPLRGAHMAKVFGIDAAVVEMIRHHHDPPRQDQTIELTMLQKADNKN